MKFSNFLLLSLTGLIISCSDTDDYIEPIYNPFDVSDLITIPEAQETYSLNDTLYIDLTVPTTLVSDQDEDISLAELVPNAQFAETYFFRYETEDTEQDTPIAFNTDDVFIVEQNGTGEIIPELKGLAIAGLKNGNAYTARLGIKLTEAGSFYLSPYSEAVDDAFYVILRDRQTTDIVELKTTIEGQDPANRFSYTVAAE
ncbi:hypothetical protein [Leeuwenhoekiella marinoflava]|uniref:Uncharacterized protein n=2 Tax=Leeuwenhoekiella marinoflava TaxID=988 RepID=A0A4Q0PKA9_9FLAO|nr:hypothetical protein [Leeuwenhoekiella marinoflava]RXG28383.1 hypothetical protein DSL99_2384 [Leeuwenhoekiella marinoflava]SHF50489.1 hypothetical protein SAMN02745246_02675 [Leeuwenhoekiella marinoflava DSM 3653]